MILLYMRRKAFLKHMIVLNAALRPFHILLNVNTVLPFREREFYLTFCCLNIDKNHGVKKIF